MASWRSAFATVLGGVVDDEEPVRGVDHRPPEGRRWEFSPGSAVVERRPQRILVVLAAKFGPKAAQIGGVCVDETAWIEVEACPCLVVDREF